MLKLGLSILDPEVCRGIKPLKPKFQSISTSVLLDSFVIGIFIDPADLISLQFRSELVAGIGLCGSNRRSWRRRALLG